MCGGLKRGANRVEPGIIGYGTNAVDVADMIEPRLTLGHDLVKLIAEIDEFKGRWEALKTLAPDRQGIVLPAWYKQAVPLRAIMHVQDGQRRPQAH